MRVHFKGAGSKASGITGKFRSHLSIDTEYAGVTTKGSTRKMNSEVLITVGVQCIFGAVTRRTVQPDLLMYPKC